MWQRIPIQKPEHSRIQKVPTCLNSGKKCVSPISMISTNARKLLQCIFMSLKMPKLKSVPSLVAMQKKDLTEMYQLRPSDQMRFPTRIFHCISKSLLFGDIYSQKGMEDMKISPVGHVILRRTFSEVDRNYPLFESSSYVARCRGVPTIERILNFANILSSNCRMLRAVPVP
jgi:hypothetical protein